MQTGYTSQNRNQYGNNLTLPPAPLNPSNTQFRGASSGFVPGLTMNNNVNNSTNPSSNMNTRTTPNLPSREGLSFVSQIQESSAPSTMNPTSTSTINPQLTLSGFPPGMNSNQSTQPPPNNSQPSVGGFIPGMNLNQTQAPVNNAQSPMSALFPGMNANKTSAPANNTQSPMSTLFPGMNANQTPAPANNAQPSASGFPPGMNLNQTPAPTNNTESPMSKLFPGMNANQTPAPANNTESAMSKLFPGMNANQTPTPTNNTESAMSKLFPGMNANQTPTPTNNTESAMSKLFPGMNANQTPAPANNTQSPMSKLFPGMNANQTSPPPTSNLINAQQGPLTKHRSSFRNQSNDDDNVSRLELDYPIENVLIDANIPSAIAIKINEAVEQDRRGNTYHIHRYTFEPSTSQQISSGNNQHVTRRLVDNPYHGGTRHIREIHNDHQNSLFNDMTFQGSNKENRPARHLYSQTSLNEYVEQLLQNPRSIVIHAQNSNDLQHILNQHLSNNQRITTYLSNNQAIPTYLSNNQTIPTQPSINSFQLNTNPFTEPFFHYTASALPYDPMRIY
jgi:hypothetical protein